MKLVIQMWPLDRLHPYSRKLRRNDDAVKRMAASITEFGFRIPVLVTSAGELIDGDLRVKAAALLGLTEVPVIVCDDLNEEQVRALRLIVNRSATWAAWDPDAVAQEIADLQQTGFDLNLTGFDGREVERMLAGLRDPLGTDDVEQPPPVPASRRGDLWLLEAHRVLCGDATAASDVERLCGSTVPSIMVTDPPYGVAYDPRWRERAGLGEQRQTGVVQNDDRADWAEAYRLYSGDVVYCWHAGLYAAVVAHGLEQSGFRIYSQIIWVKQHFALSRGHYHWQHEPCWYAVRNGKPARWCGDRKQSTVWEVSNLNPFGGAAAGEDDEATGHGTQKPVELMRRPILNHTEPGETVYDPFLGSGATLVAAETTNRNCYGLEINPAYVDLIVTRWQKLTGQQALLEGDGRSFDVIAQQRRSISDAVSIAETDDERQIDSVETRFQIAGESISL